LGFLCVFLFCDPDLSSLFFFLRVVESAVCLYLPHAVVPNIIASHTIF